MLDLEKESITQKNPHITSTSKNNDFIQIRVNMIAVLVSINENYRYGHIYDRCHPFTHFLFGAIST